MTAQEAKVRKTRHSNNLLTSGRASGSRAPRGGGPRDGSPMSDAGWIVGGAEWIITRPSCCPVTGISKQNSTALTLLAMQLAHAVSPAELRSIC
ncbi:unnamed protein product [Macrosiphum euphorbiae]|uniref:Uncharacterized protein n=1 Tax=Macrosiphum euphorbiae TaxID=13131 RepID=A0AAV0XRJ4_9HEMI|nr:unnamed protein product [Macrosiphum euphorbiae]